MRRRWPWLLLVVLAVAAGVLALRANTPGDAPDVAAIAHSDETAAADRAAVVRVDHVFATGTIPGLDFVGDEVSDRCYIPSPTDFHGNETPVYCDRTVVCYFGFDNAEPTKALTAAGWGPSVHDAQWVQNQWTQRPHPLQTMTEFGRPSMPHDPQSVVYREARPADVAALSRKAFQHHGFALALAVTDRYRGAR